MEFQREGRKLILSDKEVTQLLSYIDFTKKSLDRSLENPRLQGTLLYKTEHFASWAKELEEIIRAAQVGMGPSEYQEKISRFKKP
jgi:hypothetical protein